MGLIGRLLSFILTTALLVTALYLLASSFGLLPEKYNPNILFAAQIKAVEDWTAKDANTDSITSGVSKKINAYLTGHDADASATSDSTAEEKPASPMDKARKAVDQYEKRMEEEKKVLDNL